jgi:glutamate N-acetyltransferase/amino-acid N-acetyltransferase
MTLPIPSGYRFAAVPARVRDWERDDLALVVSDRPAAAAGVFTQNRVVAAPVQISKSRVPAAGVRAIVVNAGNANACTGDPGRHDALAMTAEVARCINCEPDAALVASTGVIGRAMPMDRILPGIATAAGRLAAGPAAFEAVSRAIMTTDTRPKVAHRMTGDATVLGFAKGAAMIGPNLATMLGFVLTDARVTPADLQNVLARAADQSFNCVSVEGHTSTNDTVFLLANGTGTLLGGGELDAFALAVEEVCRELAEQIADDAEGAAHRIAIHVVGLASESEARQIAKCIAESALVKAAVYGGDPNWGRIVSAAGYAGVPFLEEELTLWVGPHLLYERGLPTMPDPVPAAAYLRENRQVEFRLLFARGPARCTFFTSDLTPEYVRLNADYTT